MKKLILLSTIFFCSMSYGQKETPNLPIDSITSKITYSDVVFVDSLVSKQELFSRAREWFAKAYNSSTNVIQMEDKENGKIIGKAITPIYSNYMGEKYVSSNIYYTISIYIKDGRYKYIMTDFYHKYPPESKLTDLGLSDIGACEKMFNTTDKLLGRSLQYEYNKILFQMDENIKALIADLNASVIHKGKNIKTDNW